MAMGTHGSSMGRNKFIGSLNKVNFLLLRRIAKIVEG